MSKQLSRPRQKQASTKPSQHPVESATEQGQSTTTTVLNAANDQQQSVEIVQTLILASLSCVTYLRGLLPERCFDFKEYHPTGMIMSFEDFANSNMRDVQGLEKPVGTFVRIVRPGRSHSADKFLRWLDGAYDALKRNYLRSLQLSVFEDPKNSSNVMETWTFTFAYAPTPGSPAGVASMDVEGRRSNGEVVTYRQATYALQSLIRRINSLCGTFPDLPSTRFIAMHLSYTEGCDPDYEPAGFTHSKDHEVMFPSGPSIAKDTLSLDGVDAGHHRVALQVSYVDAQEDGISASSEYSRPNPYLPSTMDYSARSSREADIDTAMVDQYEAKGSEETNPMGAGSRDQPVAIQNTPTTPDGNSLNSTGRSESQQHAKADNSAALADSFMMSMERHSLNEGMDLDEDVCAESPTPAPRLQDPVAVSNMRPASLQTAGDSLGKTESQQRKDLDVKARLRKMREVSTQEACTQDTQVRGSMTDETTQAAQIPKSSSRLQLSQAKLQNIIRQTRPPRNGRDITGASELEVIDCQCGWNEEGEYDGDLVECEFCKTWQHLQCYGYKDSQDSRLPEVHACYKCLLQEAEAPLLRDLQHLTLLRKGASAIQNFGYENEKQFAKLLHCDLKTAGNVAKHLKNQGYLVPIPGSRSKSKGRLRFQVASGRVLQRMIEEYFDPTAKIAHHFELNSAPKELHISMASNADSNTFAIPEIPVTQKASSREPLASRSHQERVGTSMDQPTTPRAGRGKVAAFTEPSTAFQTPTNRKRTLEDAMEDVEDAMVLRSGRKRLRSSVTSEFIGVFAQDSPTSIK